MTRPSSRGRGVAAIRGTSATPPVIRPPLIFRTHPPVWPMSPGCPLRGHRGMTGVWVFADTWAEHSEEGPCRLRCHATDTAPANQTTFFPDAGPALSRAEIRDPRLILQAMSPPSVPDGAARLREKCVGGGDPFSCPRLGGRPLRSLAFKRLHQRCPGRDDVCDHPVGAGDGVAGFQGVQQGVMLGIGFPARLGAE